MPQLHAAAVTSVGAQFAAETLRDRFVVSSNMGIAQLKSEIDASTDKKVSNLLHLFIDDVDHVVIRQSFADTKWQSCVTAYRRVKISRGTSSDS